MPKAIGTRSIAEHEPQLHGLPEGRVGQCSGRFGSPSTARGGPAGPLGHRRPQFNFLL